MSDEYKPKQGSTLRGIDHATITCRKCVHKGLVPQTETHRAEMITVKGNVIIRIDRVYTLNKNNPI
jgi:hypothetical protein